MGGGTYVPEAEEFEEKDMLCPICMQVMEDAFLTACGHSFCYMCIFTHLRNSAHCPSCSHFLTTKLIFPNILLNKLLAKCGRSRGRHPNTFEHVRLALQQGCDVSVAEVDGQLPLLTEKKRTAEQQESETNTLILLDFLHCLRKQKLKQLNQIQKDLHFIEEDIAAIHMHEKELCRANANGAQKLKTLADDPNPQFNTSARSRLESTRWLHSQFPGLQDYYLQKRRYWATKMHDPQQSCGNFKNKGGYNPGLMDFQTVLSTFERYNCLRLVAELRHEDPFHPSNIVSSVEFDRDDELFATAGVSRCIKVFDFSSVIKEPADVHCPVAEMSTRTKLSCLSWNKHIRNYMASSDYEGIVTVWDVTTRQSVMEYGEHEKRAWSVDFSCTEPSMLISGSDDCKVKIWSIKQEASVLNINMKANICSVKYNPGSNIYVAVGSADHQIHYYDLRNISQPLHVFSGHKKAVSYVKFLSNNGLVSASTDSTLHLWDINEKQLLREFRGHTNNKNFVGLTVNNEYIACGSETNEVFVYHKAISKAAVSYRFDSDNDGGDDGNGSHFISAACWKSDSPTILTANSQGTVKILELAASSTL